MNRMGYALLTSLAIAVSLLVSHTAVAAPDVEPAFRDVQIFGLSEPAERGEAGVIDGRLVLRLRTTKTLPARVVIDAEPTLGLLAVDRRLLLEPGDNIIDLPLAPQAGFESATARGRVWLGRVADDSTADRDLHIAVRGPDPASFDDAKVERIPEAARIVGVHAPRTEARLAELLRRWEQHRQTGPITIAANGVSRYAVVLQPMDVGDSEPEAGGDQLAAWLAGDRTPEQRRLSEAVSDLVRVIEQQSGARLPVVSRGPADAGQLIEIAIARIDASDGDWHPDGYLLRVDDGRVRIHASTLTGLTHGVYGLLTEHLDAFWFQPGELGEEILIPEDRTVRLHPVMETRQPAFFSANGMSWGHAQRWDGRNRARVLEGRMGFGHAWRSLISPSDYPYDEFPDMWARDRKGRVMVRDVAWTFTQFCSTSPKVIEIVADRIKDRFERTPNALVASIDPNDLAPLCLCERCLSLDREYGVEEQDGQRMADRLLHFSREIHSRLKPEHQDKYLGVLAYAAQTELPVSARPHDRHATIVCQFPPLFDHSRPFTDPSSPWARRFHRIVEGWAGMTPQTGFYDYYGHYNYFGPWGVVHKLREDIPAFRDAGGTFLVMEAQPNFAMQGLNHYIAAQLIWRPDADVDLLLEQFFRHYYGPATGPMRRFWGAAERWFALERPGVDTHLRVAANEGFWAELEEHLSAAEQTVQSDDAPKRFRQRVAFHRDGLTFARLMHRLDYSYVPLRAPVEDVDAALAFVRRHSEDFQAFRERYPHGEGHWPPFVAPYFHRPIDRMISELEALKADPTRSREIGEALDSIGG